VGDDDQDILLFPVQFQEQSRHCFCGLAIQISRRFVTKDKLRSPYQGPCQSDTLFFAARQLVRAVMNPRAEADLLEQVESSALLPIVCILRKQGWNEDVFQHCALGKQMVVLEYETDLLIAERSKVFLIELVWILAAQQNGPCSGRLECAQNVKECAFSAPRRAYDGNAFAGAH
jgi:hypothetical protein